MHGPGSRNKLTRSQARFFPGTELFDRIGRALCTAECLPRKELHEAWEMAHRIRRHFRGGRVVDLCAGYGLLAQVMLLLDETLTGAIALDVRPAANHLIVHDAMVAAFPQLEGRITFVRARLETQVIAPTDLVVSAHACGPLTDEVIAAAANVGARVAVIPCCHRFRFREDLAGVEDPALAIDLERATQLRARGYSVWTGAIPKEVSPQNRVLLGAPAIAGVDDDRDHAAWFA